MAVFSSSSRNEGSRLWVAAADEFQSEFWTPLGSTVDKTEPVDRRARIRGAREFSIRERRNAARTAYTRNSRDIERNLRIERNSRIDLMQPNETETPKFVNPNKCSPWPGLMMVWYVI